MPPAGLTAHSTANQGIRGDGVTHTHNQLIISLFYYLHKCFISGRLFMIVNDIRFLDFARNDTVEGFPDFARNDIAPPSVGFVLSEPKARGICRPRA